eukprot:scaffold89856_cov17-Prasinocladus_malaysianus.AAC.1
MSTCGIMYQTRSVHKAPPGHSQPTKAIIDGAGQCLHAGMRQCIGEEPWTYRYLLLNGMLSDHHLHANAIGCGTRFVRSGHACEVPGCTFLSHT